MTRMAYQRLHLSLHLRLLHGARHLKSVYFFHHFGDAPFSSLLSGKLAAGCGAFRRGAAEVLISDLWQYL